MIIKYEYQVPNYHELVCDQLRKNKEIFYYNIIKIITDSAALHHKLEKQLLQIINYYDDYDSPTTAATFIILLSAVAKLSPIFMSESSSLKAVLVPPIALVV